MFDKVDIVLTAGGGGNGVVSFRREKYVPFGGPDGGDGGNGGDVVLKADSGITDYRAFRNRGVYKASNGKHGEGKKKHGKNGENLILTVPVGTVVFRKADTGAGEVLADLDADGKQVVVARGGKGGLGNVHYTTSTRQAPELAQKGEAGEEFEVLLDLRLIADVGIIGYPNVGKSSLLASASAANPEIANYPFTTKEPMLGVVTVGNDDFVLAEIPGLIVGAHLGRGLGYDFLHHAIRTRLFIHLIDGSSASPVDDMIAVNNELSLYDPDLLNKPQIVVVNKVDMPEVKEKTGAIRDLFKEAGQDVMFISASTGEGVERLMAQAWDKLQAVLQSAPPAIAPEKIFRPRYKDTGISIHREGDTFIIEAPGLARVGSGTSETTPELLGYVRDQLVRMNYERLLRRAGIKPGDKVRCGSVEWEWF